MKVKLVIDIECGDTTCASEPSKFCKYLGARKFGISPACMLFPTDSADYRKFETYTDLIDNEDGWVQRCKQCLEYGV